MVKAMRSFANNNGQKGKKQGRRKAICALGLG